MDVIIDRSEDNHLIKFEDICSEYGCHKLMNLNVKITVNENANYDATFARNALPRCSSMFLLNKRNEPRVTGYFKNIQWKSLLCSHSLDSLESLSIPLQNKVVYFFGDSTIRQFFTLI